jgi:site-specific DNA recombinase
MARVLGRCRISRSTEESTSIARQKEAIEASAKMGGHEVVGWAIDEDVSGAVSPFNAPELGQWLAPEKLPEWDILVTYRLDRIARRVIPLNRLFGLILDEGKSLVSTSESIDLSHWVGRLVANVIAGVAEGELEAIQERTRGSYKKLRTTGRWPGGTPPFGYQAVPRELEGWQLAIKEDEANLLREVVNRVLDGASINGIARWLDTTGYKPRRGGHWTSIGLTRLLRGRSILGQATLHGKLVLDDDGLPLRYADEGVIDEDTRERVLAELSTRKVTKKRDNGVSLLLNVAKCAHCQEWLYLFVKTAKGKQYRYWRCSGKTKRKNNCNAPSVPADELEAFVEEHLLDEIGKHERTERVFIPATGHSSELEQVERAIEGIRKERDLGLYDDDDDNYFDRLSGLVKRRKSLEDTEALPARWECRGLNETYSEAWVRMDTAERRTLLLETGVTVEAAAKPLAFHFHVPADVVQRSIPEYRPPEDLPMPQ